MFEVVSARENCGQFRPIPQIQICSMQMADMGLVGLLSQKSILFLMDLTTCRTKGKEHSHSHTCQRSQRWSDSCICPTDSYILLIFFHVLAPHNGHFDMCDFPHLSHIVSGMQSRDGGTMWEHVHLSFCFSMLQWQWECDCERTGSNVGQARRQAWSQIIGWIDHASFFPLNHHF